MKRARSEQMQALILSYLKKRNYSEVGVKVEFQFEESLKEMSKRSSEISDLSTLNSVSLSVFSLDEYFSVFIDFVSFTEKNSKNFDGLQDLVHPIFCHMYLDLVMAGRKADAGLFLEHFRNKITCSDILMSMEELSQAIQKLDIISSKKMMEFRSKKFVVKLWKDSHSLLMRYLYGQSSLIIMKIINAHIDIIHESSIFDLFSTSNKEKDFKITEDSYKTQGQKMAKKLKQVDEEKLNSKQDTVTLSAPSLMSPPTPVSMTVDPAQPFIFEVEIKTLQSSMQRVSDIKPNVGNICLHRLQDVGSKGLTHTILSNDFCTLSTGFEDSTGMLWNIRRNISQSKTPNQHSSSNERNASNKQFKQFNSQPGCMKASENATMFNHLSPNVSKIHFGCDFFENIKARLESPNIDNMDLYAKKVLRAHSGAIYSSCFSHNDRYMLTCSGDTTVRLWDTVSAKNKVVYRGHTYPVWCICMSAFSLYFATGSYDKTARLWTTERTFPMRTFAGHHGDVESIAFHGNASYIATADKTIRLWDIGSGKTVRLMIGHWAPVRSLTFSPNGKYLASSGEDGRIRMWDIASGALIKEMRGHNGVVYSLGFSPDGCMLASGGVDSYLRVWSTRTSQNPTSRNNTDTSDENVNPDLIGKWNLSSGPLHEVKYEASNLLHCVLAES